MNKPTLPGATGYAPVEGAEFPAQPDVIWARDANGKQLPWGRPNFDKPGVTEAVNRAGFYGEQNSCANRGTLPVIQLARINRFEDEQERNRACTHCGASRDEAATRCTVPGAQSFPCDGEAP